MDNNAYERKMFDAVNQRSNEKELDRMAEADAAREEQGYILHCQRINAAVKLVVWLAAFLCALVVMFYLNWLNIAPPELPAVICGVVGLVTGLRVNALARAFRNN